MTGMVNDGRLETLNYNEHMWEDFDAKILQDFVKTHALTREIPPHTHSRTHPLNSGEIPESSLTKPGGHRQRQKLARASECGWVRGAGVPDMGLG